jgi:hypothetical protein
VLGDVLQRSDEVAGVAEPGAARIDVEGAEAPGRRREQRRVVARVAPAADEEERAQRRVGGERRQHLALEDDAIGAVDPVAAANSSPTLRPSQRQRARQGRSSHADEAARQARPPCAGGQARVLDAQARRNGSNSSGDMRRIPGRRSTSAVQYATGSR